MTPRQTDRETDRTTPTPAATLETTDRPGLTTVIIRTLATLTAIVCLLIFLGSATIAAIWTWQTVLKLV